MFIKKKKGQAILEYAILLGVVIAALLIMQIFVKRGYEGSLKSSADKMGDQFSGGGTTIQENTTMTNDQTVLDQVSTSTTMQSFVPAARDVLSDGAYSYTTRTGGTISADTKQETDAAKLEKTRWNEYQTANVNDFPDPY